jgi:signal transduction histidine kinase
VTVALERAGDTVVLDVTDDGAGFDPGQRAVSSRRLGLVSMRERAADLGGVLTITSATGEGTTVHAEVPAR